MRISLWDLDWYNKFSFSPNYKVQKISSYHKQKGDLINFIEEESHISFDYDIMYIVKDKKVTPMPPSRFIDNQKVRLIGKEFDYYDNYYELPALIEMVRPDYNLYEIPDRNVYANATVLKLLHETKLLPAFQDPVNYAAQANARTLVVDEKFWQTDKETLLNCFEIISKHKNIAFMEPISLKRIMENDIKEKFINLNYSRGTIFKFKNDYGSTYKNVVDIINLMMELKEKNPSISLRGFPVKGIINNHWKDSSTAILDLERILKILDYSKMHKVKIIVKTPSERTVTPYWAFFDLMEKWTTEYYNISYIEAMISTRQLRTHEQWHEIINDPKKWSTPRIYFLLHLINKYPDIIFRYGFRKWGDECLDKTWIDLEKIVKSKNTFEQKEILQKLQEEILKEEE